ncbi:MAG: GNAT family N-acetyltransferase [Leptolyngbyaceae cyanobacterium SU_3_3]|nr:GNAT family N-acetyltransferase [Leptolyngbyaceae cyanobacterium SU_3_3]
MEPVFKLASISNIEKLIKLMSELYAYDHLPFDEQTACSALQLILGNDSYGCIHLIYINEEIIGYLIVTFGFSLEYGGRDAFVDEIYVQEKYRRQGIGKKSLQFAEEICRGRGVQALHLEVERENTNAQAVYRKAGFADHDRYLLTKHL